MVSLTNHSDILEPHLTHYKNNKYIANKISSMFEYV